ncbi:TRAP transporter large permease [Magnetococcales bacterium HHB-1]
MEAYAPLMMFAGVCLALIAGYPVALSLAGTALIFGWIGEYYELFDPAFLEAAPNRFYGIMTNEVLIAVPLFIFMGVMLERSKIAENLLDTMATLFGSLRGGLGISVTLVGMLMAASTGIVGATVVTMGLLSLPTMLQRGYAPSLATGTICASGTLGQIIPPSIVLVLLGDVLSSAYQQAQLDMGIFSPRTISVGDLFLGALIPGLLLVLFYILYLIIIAYFKPEAAPAVPKEMTHEKGQMFIKVVRVLLPPLFLILSVLGSILAGIATPTEAAAVGAVGALLLAYSHQRLSWKILKGVVQDTTQVTSMVFFIFVGAAIFSLVFRGFGGDDVVRELLLELPGGAFGAMLAVMLLMFLLGFFIDFIEIIFVVVPIVAPILLTMELDPIWLGVMIAINLQTSFLTPPFGFALFYLRGVAPASVTTEAMYRGIIPFIIIQLFALIALAIWPTLATWLPLLVYGE